MERTQRNNIKEEKISQKKKGKETNGSLKNKRRIIIENLQRHSNNGLKFCT